MTDAGWCISGIGSIALRPSLPQSAIAEEAAEDAFELPDELDESLLRLDEALTVHAALDRLSPDCHEILDRFFCRDESYRTISAQLELPSGTVASRIARCLSRLKDELEPGRKPEPAASGEKVGEPR